MSEQGATAYLLVKEVYYLTYQKWITSAAVVRLQLKRMEMTRGQSKETDQKANFNNPGKNDSVG